jgi:hypothetical protein
MSVWALSRVPQGRAIVEADDNDLARFVGLVLKWIPADLAVIYTAFIKALVDDPKDDPNIWLTVIFITLSPIVLALLAATSDHGAGGKTLAIRAFLSIPAFAIWSLTVPNSGWDQIDRIAKHPAWVAGFAALGGFLFSLIAELVERRAGGSNGG